MTQALEFAPDGTLYGFDDYYGLFTFDPGTGSFSDVNPVLVEPDISAIAFTADGRLIGTGNDGVQAYYYDVDPTTGVSSLLSTGLRTIIRGMVAVPEPPCGNGLIDGTETCDDGDITPGDGCDATCQIETGWICTGQPSVCSKITLPTLSSWSQLALMAGLLGAGLGVWRGRAA